MPAPSHQEAPGIFLLRQYKLQLRVNYRNHRKIVVIDGRIGFVGGFNVGREYLGRSKRNSSPGQNGRQEMSPQPPQYRYVYLSSIQTVYCAPDIPVSGVDVRIMIPSKPDHLFVYWATYSYIGEMIEAGARCYTYDQGFLHTKCLCIDGLVSCMGTANMDVTIPRIRRRHLLCYITFSGTLKPFSHLFHISPDYKQKEL